jgi:7-carboxy-7-deazaguanine synthase
MESKPRFKVSEIFHSIQGESSLAGLRFGFVRLVGCPLRCTYCDTTYSYQGGEWKTIQEILSKLAMFDVKWVCVTGGEPLAHPHAATLVKGLVASGYQVTIETSGEQNVQEVVGLAKIIMDIKTPSSQEKASVCFENLKYLTATDEIKFVIGTEEDFLWAAGICKEYKLTENHHVLFSPVFGHYDLKLLAQQILEQKLDVALQTQLHKHIWGANVQGV